MCPVAIYKSYRSHRPEDALSDDSRMFLQPLGRVTTNTWYSRTPLGKNTLAKMVKTMYSEAGLGGRHTNHSVRRSMIESALDNGIHETRIMQVSYMMTVAS